MYTWVTYLSGHIKRTHGKAYDLKPKTVIESGVLYHHMEQRRQPLLFRLEVSATKFTRLRFDRSAENLEPHKTTIFVQR